MSELIELAEKKFGKLIIEAKKPINLPINEKLSSELIESFRKSSSRDLYKKERMAEILRDYRLGGKNASKHGQIKR